MKQFKAEQRKLKPTKKNMVAIYKHVDYDILSIVKLDEFETSYAFKTNLSRKVYSMIVRQEPVQMPLAITYEPISIPIQLPVFDQITLQECESEESDTEQYVQ